MGLIRRLRWRFAKQALDLRGIPTHECICGCDTFKILARFEEGQIVWYTTAGYCFGCGAAVTVPTEQDTLEYA